jgi:hypothetical protein
MKAHAQPQMASLPIGGHREEPGLLDEYQDNHSLTRSDYVGLRGLARIALENRSDALRVVIIQRGKEPGHSRTAQVDDMAGVLVVFYSYCVPGDAFAVLAADAGRAAHEDWDSFYEVQENPRTREAALKLLLKKLERALRTNRRQVDLTIGRNCDDKGPVQGMVEAKKDELLSEQLASYLTDFRPAPDSGQFSPKIDETDEFQALAPDHRRARRPVGKP